MKILFRVEYLQSKSWFVHRVTTIPDSRLNINYDDIETDAHIDNIDVATGRHKLI